MTPFLLIAVVSLVPAAARQPDADQVTLTRSGDDACVNLPRPPEGVPGLREYVRMRIERDGQLVVTAAQLPFTSNQGYVYRQTEKGWVANEVDYLLLRTPVPVRGGFEEKPKVIFFCSGGPGKDQLVIFLSCGKNQQFHRQGRIL